MSDQWKSRLIFIALTVFTMAIWAVVLMNASTVDTTDSTIFLRVGSGKLIYMTLFWVLATGLLLAFDAVTPNDWLAQIYKDSIACAFVVITWLYCLTWVFTSP